MTRTLDDDLARMMRRQHGLLHRRQAYELGVSPYLVRRWVTCGRWVEVDHDVFGATVVPPTWHARVLAACLSTDGVASHRSSGVLWLVDGLRRGRPDVTVRRGAHRRRDVRLHQTHSWDLIDRTDRDAIPVTGIARTVVDLARLLPEWKLTSVIDDVERRGLVTVPGLMTVADAHACRGRKGIPMLRQLLERRLEEDGVPQSVFNRLVGELLASSGLPVPVFEHEIFADGRLVARVDLAYPDRRVAIELQSWRWHERRDAMTRDAARRAEITRLGWTVVEFTWRQYVERPSWLTRIVGDHLELADRRSCPAESVAPE